MTHIAIPKIVFPEWSMRPWSEMVHAVEDHEGGLVDASELANGLRAADRLKPETERFRPKTPCEFEICGEVAVFRHGREFTRKDVAALFWQGW